MRLGRFGVLCILLTALALPPLAWADNIPRPVKRPDRVSVQPQVARAAIVPAPRRLFGRKPKLCGVRGIEGKAAAPIPARIQGCGLPQGVRVTAVHDVRLSQPAMIDCGTAVALADWVQTGLKPAIGTYGGGVGSIKVVAHYACRTRNNRPGAKISEHGRGKAVDIAAVGLKDGREITVLRGWGHKTHGPMLRKMHRAACGPFGTVLGPKADRYHRDHFHFDTARHRSGPYCR